MGGENSSAPGAASEAGEVISAQLAKLCSAGRKDIRAEILQTEFGRHPVEPGENITSPPDLRICRKETM